jgi:putative transposase
MMLRANGPIHPPSAIMPQSYESVPLHLVFSTKGRRPFLRGEIGPRLHAYIATVARDLGCECPRVGGFDDHVHIAVFLSRTLAIATLVQKLKTSSSAWIKRQGDPWADFAWQRGYSVFGFSLVRLPIVLQYIDRQPEHHATKSFEDELRLLLTEAGIQFDEKTMWD